ARGAEIGPLAPRARLTPTALRSLAGQPVARVEVDLPGDVPPLRARLAEAGIEDLEADIRFASRYLIDHRIPGAFRVTGPFDRPPGVGRVYRNPALEPAEWAPTLRVLAFDIETSLDGRRLLSIAATGAGSERVWLVRPSGPSASAAPSWPDGVAGAEIEE